MHRAEQQIRWRRLVAEHATSGLTLKAFAAREGVSVNTLSYWKYKRARASAPADLVPVRVIDDAMRVREDLVLELGAARLCIPWSGDERLLRVVIDSLRRPC